jgi:hypothetical protein
MVDVQATNDKLLRRSETWSCGSPAVRARRRAMRSGRARGSVKLAVLLSRGCDLASGTTLLDRARRSHCAKALGADRAGRGVHGRVILVRSRFPIRLQRHMAGAASQARTMSEPAAVTTARCSLVCSANVVIIPGNPRRMTGDDRADDEGCVATTDALPWGFVYAGRHLERVEIELNRMGFPRGAKRDSS